MGNFTGRVALVTGAASGIGRATAQLLASDGAAVFAADINAAGVDSTIQAITKAGGIAIGGKLDVTQEADWQNAIDRTMAEFGKLNILCNVAGIATASELEDFPLEQWNREIAINLTGTFLGCRYGVNAIKQCKEPGAIVNVGSLFGLYGGPIQAGYNASKGGIRTLTKSVALNCAKNRYPIRCNAVHPTYVDTGLIDQFEGMFSSREQMLSEFGKDVPVGRVLAPIEIARVIRFLASEDSSAITGAEIVTDGGHTAGIATRFEG